MQTFGDLSRKLVEEQRISVVPVIPASKDPGYFMDGNWHTGLKWGRYKSELPTKEDINRWGSWPDVGIALVLGKLSGLVAVDFDYHSEYHAAIAALLPDTPIKKVGAKGLTHFFRYNGESNQGWDAADGLKVVEILSNHLCVIPPSVHPEGCLYEWRGKALHEVDKEMLPVIPAEFPALVRSLFAVWNPDKYAIKAQTLRNPSQDYEKPELAKIIAILDHITPDLSREHWLRVGMAIHSSFPGDDGFSVFDNWSCPGRTYNAKDALAVWKSFKQGGGINIETLFHYAKEGGWRPEKKSPLPVVDFTALLEEKAPLPEQKEEKPAAFALPVPLLTSAPGVVGEIAAWISDTNFYYQPSYALAAALSFVGMAKGRNVCTEENGRTNLLTIAVGPSSSGKSMPNKRLKTLAHEAGIASHLLGEPASETGMMKSMSEAGCKGLLLWDEIGIAFKGMFSSFAPSYKSGIVRQILKLYSMADEVVLGYQYSNNDGKNPRIDLNQPCLCLYGTTTQEGIFGAFSSTEAINGFAARLLIFETHDYLAERKKLGPTVPPTRLVEAIKKIAADGTSIGNIVAPRIVPYTDEAREHIQEAGKRFEALKNNAIKNKKPAEESIWGRAYEQTTKVALTVEDGTEITLSSVEWSVMLITALCERMILAANEQIADNDLHAEVNRVLGIIKSADGWMSTTELFKRTRYLARQKRQDILLALEEEEKIEKKEWTTVGRKKLVYRAI